MSLTNTDHNMSSENKRNINIDGNLQMIEDVLQVSAQEMQLIRELYLADSKWEGGIPFERTRQILGENQNEVLHPCFYHEDGKVYLSPVVLSYLKEEIPTLPDGMEMIVPNVRDMYGYESELNLAQKMLQDINTNLPCAIVLSGAVGSGRDFFARQICAYQKVPLIDIETRQRQYSKRAVNEILLAVLLYDSLPCIHYSQQYGELLLKQLAEYLKNVLVIQDSVNPVTEDIGFDVLMIPLNNPYKAVKEQIVKDLLNDAIMKKLPRGISCSQLAARQLPMGEFIRYIRSLRLEALTGSKNILDSIYHSQSIHLNLLPATRSFKELKLPKTQYEQLKAICQMVSAREVVMKNWGFADKFSYGNGMSILFYGAPGTGKTMAAQVMANELGMPLYRVDLSQLISKYIGETQKNIGKIFDEADKCDCILLFDEADAIFSKRSDVSDSQDRYSNAETAYLLQRIEQYQGVSILATNLLQNFDDAFRRRISYMLHFPMPDVSLREELWKTIFPKQTSVSNDVDTLALAQAFELSGAAIKNAALHSAYMAAAQQSEIGMRHILSGIQNEYSKSGKNMSSSQMELIKMYQ